MGLIHRIVLPWHRTFCNLSSHIWDVFILVKLTTFPSLMEAGLLLVCSLNLRECSLLPTYLPIWVRCFSPTNIIFCFTTFIYRKSTMKTDKDFAFWKKKVFGAMQVQQISKTGFQCIVFEWRLNYSPVFSWGFVLYSTLSSPKEKNEYILMLQFQECYSCWKCTEPCVAVRA